MSETWTAQTARWYAERYGEHPTNRMTVDLARLQADDVVVDIGCGSGAAVRAAADTAARVMGVDPTEEMVRIARDGSEDHPRADRISFFLAGAGELPLDDACATVVLAINSIDHWADVEGGLAEVGRVLRPGGRVLVSFEAWQGEPDGVIANLERAGFVDVFVEAHPIGDEGDMVLVRAVRP